MLSFTTSHAQFTDDFIDGNLNANPVWIGNVDSFEVLGQELHLNAPANSSESYLVTESQGVVDGYWEFFVRMEFNPSSGNRAKVYLMSDNSDLQASLNGYYVLLGNTDDEVSLYRQIGFTSTKIIDGLDNLLNVNLNELKVKVTRDAVGNFSLFADTSLLGNSYLLQGSVLDVTLLSTAYFGVLCDYTATRSDKFWFDDFVVSTQVYVDQSAPQLLAHQLPSLNHINLIFNEQLDSTFAMQSANYVLSGSMQPSQIAYQGQQLTISFNQGFLNNSQYALHIKSKDLNGNLGDTLVQFMLTDNYPFQNLIINEIYADESPSYGMPAYEFIELKNPSSDTVFLIDWKLADASDTIVIPNDTIPPAAFLILCKTTAVSSYNAFGRCLGVPNFPSLNNAGDQLILFNKYDAIIDSLSYKSAWYANETDPLGNQKKDGGFSLERIALNTVCTDSYNWFPSINSFGASPGEENSVLNYPFPSEDIFVEDVAIENEDRKSVV